MSIRTIGKRNFLLEPVWLKSKFIASGNFPSSSYCQGSISYPLDFLSITFFNLESWFYNKKSSSYLGELFLLSLSGVLLQAFNDNSIVDNSTFKGFLNAFKANLLCWFYACCLVKLCFKLVTDFYFRKDRFSTGSLVIQK